MAIFGRTTWWAPKSWRTERFTISEEGPAERRPEPTAPR